MNPSPPDQPVHLGLGHTMSRPRRAAKPRQHLRLRHRRLRVAPAGLAVKGVLLATEETPLAEEVALTAKGSVPTTAVILLIMEAMTTMMNQ